MTIDKIIKKAIKLCLIAQIIFSLFAIVFGAGYAIRCAIGPSSAILTIPFGCIAYIGYKFMLLASVSEYREARKNSRI